jgi:protein N-terminal methyltransferase
MEPGATDFECEGVDTDGKPYESKAAMWAQALAPPAATAEAAGTAAPDAAPDASNWYKKSCDYWDTQEATVVGMLGGLDQLHDRDIRASRTFLDALERRHGLQTGAGCRCVDVGAGIGRITKALLLPLFPCVDMLEQNAEYLRESVKYIGPSAPNIGAVGKRFACGMQEFNVVDAATGESCQGRWNLVYIQWCIIFLTDDDFVAFIRKLVGCLAGGGIICIKDNIAPRGRRQGFVLDNSDSSIMRSDRYMKDLFAKAGVVVISESLQRDFPSDTFPVKAYALVSASDCRIARDENRQTARQAARPAAAARSLSNGVRH